MIVDHKDFHYRRVPGVSADNTAFHKAKHLSGYFSSGGRDRASSQNVGASARPANGLCERSDHYAPKRGSVRLGAPWLTYQLGYPFQAGLHRYQNRMNSSSIEHSHQVECAACAAQRLAFGLERRLLSLFEAEISVPAISPGSRTENRTAITLSSRDAHVLMRSCCSAR